MSDTSPIDSLAAIRVRRARLARMREAIEKEDLELAIAERVVARLQTVPKTNGIAAQAEERIMKVLTLSSEPTTQVQKIIATLRAAPNPWLDSSAELHDRIKRDFGTDIKPGSFLPILSDLKKRGVIERDGPKIALAERVKGGATQN